MKIAPPKTTELFDLLPQEPVLLMGSGPVPITREVAIANSIVLSHLGETMKNIVGQVQAMARYVFQTSTTKIIGIAGPSSAAMEMAVSSLLWPGRKVLVLNLGTFSGRFAEMARGVGAQVIELKPDGMAPFTVEAVAQALEQNSVDVLTLVQGETSCGVKNIELEQIVKLAHARGIKTIVDAVCTLSTMPLPMDEWGIDMVFVGGQKGISAIPGISLLAISENTFDFINTRTTGMPHWCLDPRRAWKFWGAGEYHYTAPVPGILALYEGLRLICEETLEKRFERHAQSSSLLQQSLEFMGLKLFTPPLYRLPSVVAICNPNQVNTKALIAHMIKEHRVEISGAFGLDIVRIGQMGEQCRPKHVRAVLRALGLSYGMFGVNLRLEEGLNFFDSHSMVERSEAEAPLLI